MANNNNNKTLNVPNLRFPEFSGEWKKCSLGNVTDFVKERISSDKLSFINYVSTENMRSDFGGINPAISIPNNTNVIHYQKGDVLLSNIRPYLRKVWSANCDGGCSADVFVFRAKHITFSFLHYIMANATFINYVMSGAKGVKMPRGDKEQMMKYIFSTPSNKEQDKISHLLHLLDERIATQNKIIEDLKKLKFAIRDNIFNALIKKRTETVSFSDVLEYEQPTKYIVASTEYSPDSTLTPVLTANKAFILGYTDEIDGVYKKGDCIVFDDFTMDAKYVTFPFKVKSSAIKILTARNDFNLYFIYEYLTWLNLSSKEHKRHYISEIEPMSINMPNIEQQDNLSKILHSMRLKICDEETLLCLFKKQKKYLFQQMFI